MGKRVFVEQEVAEEEKHAVESGEVSSVLRISLPVSLGPNLKGQAVDDLFKNLLAYDSPSHVSFNCSSPSRRRVSPSELSHPRSSTLRRADKSSSTSTRLEWPSMS